MLAPVLLTIVGAIRKDVFLLFNTPHVRFFIQNKKLQLQKNERIFRIKDQFQTRIKERFKEDSNVF